MFSAFSARRVWDFGVGRYIVPNDVGTETVTVEFPSKAIGENKLLEDPEVLKPKHA